MRELRHGDQGCKTRERQLGQPPPPPNLRRAGPHLFGLVNAAELPGPLQRGGDVSRERVLSLARAGRGEAGADGPGSSRPQAATRTATVSTPGSPPTGSSVASSGLRRSWRTETSGRCARSWTSGIADPQSSPSSEAAPGKRRRRTGWPPPPSSAAVSKGQRREALAHAARAGPPGRGGRLLPPKLPSSWPEACLSWVGHPYPAWGLSPSPRPNNDPRAKLSSGV